ncbi:hypothetical protein CW751_05520 [Brumimicrobium salinarum]|uniref:Peptidase S74 domain-containing protein n=1 Tax=Brumimicrobium salinarum TaxID=2058658 RepID=A0A2I0R401_9FLAO|nr:tail fiber domain-containing protein [Brumimicrobium salinarum]PKR81279.1 hypothetical protein CW751_05520 [Brumimicrobium salinarum]
MRQIILTVLAVLASLTFSSAVYGQAPEKFNYQAILRDNGNVMVSESVNVRFTIHDGSATGTSVYQETQLLNTDQYGRINCAVGDGNVVSGDFSTIDWGNGGKYLKVEVDNGSGFEDLGASQLLSVPYALQAGGVDGGASSDWSLDGNSVSSTDFIGTTNNEHLRFKVNGQKAGLISTNPNFVNAGTPAWNTAYGSNALDNLSIGHSNTAIGTRSLKGVTFGDANTGLGSNSLKSNVSGDKNTSIGAFSDVGTSSLTNTTAIGANAYVEQNNSMVLGSIDGVNNATANTKVGIGLTKPKKTLDVKGSVKLSDTLFIANSYLKADFASLTTNVLLFKPIDAYDGISNLGSSGASWGAVYTENIHGTDDATMFTGNGLNINTSTVIKYDVPTGTGTGNNSGFSIVNTSASNDKSINFQVGAGTNNLYMYESDGGLIGTFNGTSGAYSSTSDERLKTNFQEVESTLENLMKLKPLTYTYINNADNDRRHIGFKAQEVEKLFPTLVSSSKNADSESENGVYTMDYSGFGVIAVKAIQEQQAEIETLKEENQKLQNQIDEIKEQLNQITE